MPDDQTFEVKIRTTAETAGAEQTSEALGQITAQTEGATAATTEYVDVQKIAAEASAAAAAAKERENSIFQQQIVLLATLQQAADLKAAGKGDEAAAVEAEAAAMQMALEIQKESTASEADALNIARERLALRENETLQMEAQEALNKQLIAEETERQAAAKAAPAESLARQRAELTVLETDALRARAHGYEETAVEMEREIAIRKEAMAIQRATSLDEKESRREAELRIVAEEQIAAANKVKEEQEERILALKKAQTLQTKEQAVIETETAASGGSDQLLRGAARAAGLGRNTGLAAMFGPEVLGGIIAIQIAWDVVKHNIHSAKEETEAFKKANKEAAEESAKHFREMAESAKKGMQEAKDEAQAYIAVLKEMTALTTASQDKLDDARLKKKLADIDQQEAKDLREIVVDEGDTSHEGRARIQAEANAARENAKVNAAVDRAGRDALVAGQNLDTAKHTEATLKPQADAAKEDAEVKAMEAKVRQEIADKATAARQHAQGEAAKAANALFEAEINPYDPKALGEAAAKNKIAQGRLERAKGDEDFAKSDATEAQKKAADASSRANELSKALADVTKQVEQFGNAAEAAKLQGATAAADGAKQISQVEKAGADSVQAAVKQDSEAAEKTAAENKAATAAVRKTDETVDGAAKKGGKHGGKDDPTDFEAFFHDRDSHGPSKEFSAAFRAGASQHQIDTRPKAQQSSEHQDLEIQAGAVINDAAAAVKESQAANHGKPPPYIAEMMSLLKAQTAHIKSLSSAAGSHMTPEIQRELDEMKRELETVKSQANKARGG